MGNPMAALVALALLTILPAAVGIGFQRHLRVIQNHEPTNLPDLIPIASMRPSADARLSAQQLLRDFPGSFSKRSNLSDPIRNRCVEIVDVHLGHNYGAVRGGSGQVLTFVTDRAGKFGSPNTFALTTSELANYFLSFSSHEAPLTQSVGYTAALDEHDGYFDFSGIALRRILLSAKSQSQFITDPHEGYEIDVLIRNTSSTYQFFSRHTRSMAHSLLGAAFRGLDWSSAKRSMQHCRSTGSDAPLPTPSFWWKWTQATTAALDEQRFAVNFLGAKAVAAPFHDSPDPSVQEDDGVSKCPQVRWAQLRGTGWELHYVNSRDYPSASVRARESAVRELRDLEPDAGALSDGWLQNRVVLWTTSVDPWAKLYEASGVHYRLFGWDSDDGAGPGMAEGGVISLLVSSPGGLAYELRGYNDLAHNRRARVRPWSEAWDNESC